MSPRKSFLRQFLSPWGWWVLVAVLVTLGCLAIARSGALTAERLDREGADATAEVTGVRHTQSRDSDGDIDHDYEVTYRFVVNGQTFEKQVDVAHGFYINVRDGDLLPVRYWINDPTLSEIEPGSAAFQALFGQIATGVFGLVALVLARLGWRRARAAAWMNRHGVARQVTVKALVDTSVKVNKTPRFRATWQESDGREGSTWMARLDRLPTVGSQITILTDPEGRRASIWEGDLHA